MMNQFQIYHLFFFFIIFHFINSIAEELPSFSLQSFNGEQNPNFSSNFALLGDAHVSNEGNFVILTSSSFGPSSGQIVCKKPFKFLDFISSKNTSFSTEFTFSITPGDGDGINFVIFPEIGDFFRVFDQGYFGLSNNVQHNFVSVEYDTRSNQVSVNVGTMISNVVSYDVSSIDLVLNRGMPLKSWINYDGISKTLSIWLAKSGTVKPKNPLISCRVDLSRMWGGRAAFVGISGKSSRIISLSSWSFEISEFSSLCRKRSCLLAVLGMVIFATGCGTLVAFVGLFAWVVFFGRHSNVVLELGMNPVDFMYEKVDVTVK